VNDICSEAEQGSEAGLGNHVMDCKSLFFLGPVIYALDVAHIQFCNFVIYMYHRNCNQAVLFCMHSGDKHLACWTRVAKKKKKT
jgi:ABC-type iron transport system FetAB ATPase subunit